MSLENISSQRLWVYRLIAVLVVPTVFLACLESGLKLFEVGHSVNYTTTAANNGEDFYIHNTGFVEQFFPKEIARQPFHFSYPVKKPTDTFRIFVLGASAAQGDPEHTFGFSRILKVLLSKKIPSINFEVINTSITATNSHVVLPIAREVSQHQPDLAIIYLGNNEVVGPFGSGNSFSKMSSNLSLLRAGIQLKTTRTGQVINDLLTRVGNQKKPSTWDGMEMFLDKQFRSDSSAMETVYSHYQKNLFDIVDEFRKKKIPVILSTVGSNLKDSAPFASQNDPLLSVKEKSLWEASYQRGIKHFQARDFGNALSAFHQAERIDESFAELQFLIGHSYLETGAFAKAKIHFERARDLDTLRFRADSRINTIIHTVASQYSGDGFSLLEATELLEAHSPQKIPGEEFFYEHVHFTFHGNYILARQFAKQVMQFLPKDMAEGNTESVFLSEQDCSDLLALTKFDQLRIEKEILRRLSRPPFTNQFGHAKRMATLERKRFMPDKSLTAEDIEIDDSLYREALQNSAKDPWLHFNYGIFSKEQSDHAEAIIQFQKFTNLFPKSYKGQHELAVLLAESEQFEESLSHYENAIALIDNMETKTELRILYAYALARLGRYVDSMSVYEEALAEDPKSAVNLYHAMAKLKISTGSLSEALAFLEKAIAHNNDKADIPDIYFNYGHVLNKMKRKEQSLKAYKEAIKAYEVELETTDNENKETLLVVLGRGYFETGQIDMGKDYLQQAISEDPEKINYHLTLITALARSGRQDEALKFTDLALATMSEGGKTIEVATLQNMKNKISRLH